MRITSSAIFKYQQQKSPKKDAPIHFGLCLLAAFVSGALFLFALAPYKIWAVGLLSALVLYALLLLQSSAWRAFGIGWAYGFGTWLTGGFWLYTSIHEYGHIPPVFAFLLIVVMASIMGLFHAVMAWLFVRFLGKQPLAFASLWVIQEWTKTWLLTGFPWLFIGYAFTESPWLASLAPVVGVFGVSFVAVLLASSVLEALRGRLGYLVVTAVLLVVSFALWLINPAWTRPTGERLSVSLVQGNIPQDLKWQSEYRLQTLDIYTALSQSEWGRDLVMWPEAAIPLYSDEAAPFISEMTHRAQERDSLWVTGVPYRDFSEFTDRGGQGYPPLYNSAMAIGRGYEGLYKKQRLVPFGEYIPFQGVFDLLPTLALGDLYSHSKGDAQQAPLMVKGQAMGMAICYEVAYPGTTRKNALDAKFLATISNDAWFGTSSGPHQHLQMVQMRALETGKWFLRATNTGITAVIDDKGQVVDSLAQFERGVLRSEVAMTSGRTPYVRFGDLPILLLCAFLVGMSVWGRSQQGLKDSHKTQGVVH